MNDIRQGTCPLCGHNEIIEARPMAHASGDGHLFLAHAKEDASDFFAKPAGFLWSYSCRRCDYTQLFAQGAAKLPFGPGTSLRLITGPAPAPFR